MQRKEGRGRSCVQGLLAVGMATSHCSVKGGWEEEVGRRLAVDAATATTTDVGGGNGCCTGACTTILLHPR